MSAYTEEQIRTDSEACPVTAYQKASVCVPVTVVPMATPGTITTVCCGIPSIAIGSQCPGNATQCSFTITQTVCVKVPIIFGAEASVGEANIQCGDVSLTDLCANCK